MVAYSVVRTARLPWCEVNIPGKGDTVGRAALLDRL
jgi:hypothetical protein